MPSKLASCLALLADEDRPVRTIDLADISDLSRSQVAEFHTAWQDLSPSRRLELITVMVEQAETNIHLIFHAVLRACLTDDDAEVRRLAIEGLWEDERVSLVPLLCGLLTHDPSDDVRSTAATALGRFVLLGVLGDIAEEPARRAEAALHLAWERSCEPVSVRRRVLESLAPTDTADVHVLIGDAYYSDNELMRQSAIFAMGRSANPRWNKIVLAELNSRQPAIRFEAAEAAGEMAIRAAVQPLIQRLDDPDKDVREAAALALGKIGGPAARRALQALAVGDDERLAEAADEALEELLFNSTHLDDALDDSDGSASPRSRASRSTDEDLILTDDDDVDDDDFDDFDDADEEADDFYQDDDDYDGDDWDDDADGFDDPDEEDDSFDDAEDDLDFDDVDLD
jgi:HEAT repeat protein